MPGQITPRTTLEHLKREAKRWLKAIHANDRDAVQRLLRSLPDTPASPTLRDVQHALALEQGFPGWTALKKRVAADAPLRRYDIVADALVTAYRTPDPEAMDIVWHYFGHRRTWPVMRRYVRLDLGKTEQPQNSEEDTMTLAEAQYLVARAQGFASWEALTAYAISIPSGKTLAEKAIALCSSVEGESVQVAARSRDWDEVVSLLKAHRWPGLGASGQMTDALLERIAAVDHLTALSLDGSSDLTDDGLQHLARLPRLRYLNLGGCAITDRGLEVLRQLPNLEWLNLGWTRITDEGVRHLEGCDNLTTVNLSGTLCGDGGIRALAGKRQLTDFRSGNTVSNAGLALLHDIPAFKTWQGGEPRLALTSPDARPNFLMLRGTFTDDGMSQLTGLDGLFALDIDNSQLAITGRALAPLVELPHLTWLAFDAKDESMAYIAALPHLRFLMCQDTVAGDDGFVALSRSQTIENIWGRRCYNLRRRGFMALANMPALRNLSVSCKNVDDEGLSVLPRFPALKELMPMDIPDAGYRHIGQCQRLESLVLMYCRDTTDEATGHIAGLPALKKYFASYNRITDRTPEILSGIQSLEEITFDCCAGLTNVGVTTLARLPRLRELHVGGMPRVTAAVVAAFPPHVRVVHGL
jgi:Leucine-rich repeat (LRR) protein